MEVFQRGTLRVRIANRFKDDKKDYFIILAASIFFVTLWFHENVLLIGGDYMLPLTSVSLFQHELSYWNSWIGTGSSVPPLIAGSPPIIDTAFYSALSILGLDLSISQRAYLVISCFAGSASVYSLIKSFPSNTLHLRSAGLFGAVFFLFSPWPLNSGFPSLPLYFDFATVAFVGSLAIFAKGLQRSKLSYGFLLGPVSLVGFQVLTAVPLFVALAAILAATFVVPYLWQVRGKASAKQTYVFTAKYIAICLASIAMTSLYWFFIIWDKWSTLQSAFALRPASGDVGASTTDTFLNAMRLLGNWAFYSRVYVPYSGPYLDNVFLMGLTLVPALIGFASLLFRPKNKSLIVLCLITVMTLLLADAGDPVIGLFSNTLTTSVWFLRFEVGGFPFYLALLVEFSILIGIGASQIFHLLDRSFTDRALVKRAWRAGTVALLIIIILVNSWPYLTGAVLENWYQPASAAVSIPNQYNAANQWLDSKGGDSRIMMVPPLGSYVANYWGYQGTSTLYSQAFDRPIITGSSLSYFSTSNNLIDFAYAYMSLGLPLSLTADVASTNSTTSWSFGTQQTASSDILSVEQSSRWPTQTALRWDVNPSEINPNGHQIIATFPVKQDWLPYAGITLSVAGNYSSSDFLVGVGSTDGTVGWLNLDSGFETNSIGSITTKVLKLSDAYPRPSLSSIGALILRYNVGTSTSKWNTLFVSDIRLAHSTYNMNSLNKLLSLLNVQYTLFDSSLDSNLYPQLNATSYSQFYSQNAVVPSFSGGSIRIFSNNETRMMVSSPLQIVRLDSLTGLLTILNSSDFVPGRSAFMIGSQGHLLDNSLTNPNFGKVELTSLSAGPLYHVKAVASGPFVLVLSQTFDQRWTAEANGQNLETHFVINDYANGWLVGSRGSYDISIAFAPDQAYAVIMVTSFAAGLTLLFVFVWTNRKHPALGDVPPSGYRRTSNSRTSKSTAGPEMEKG